jgi:hypothetical protein
MKIEFEEEAHAYKINGQAVPSVTQCLQLLDPFAKVDRHVLEAARSFGHHGHKAMALVVRNTLNWSRLDSALTPYIEGGAKFLHDFRDRVVVASEVIVGHEQLRVAGTIDLIMESSTVEVVEFKFTADFPDQAGPQTAAYANLLRYMRPALRGRLVRRRVVVLKEGSYKTELLTDPSDWAHFVSCLNVTWWKIKHGI